jgi:regulator of sigma E protease
MTGEEDPSDPRSLSAQPKLWRLAVLLAGPTLNVVAAIVLAVGSYTTGLPEKWVVRINDVQQESAAQAAGLQSGDIILSAGGVRIEDSTVQLSSIIRHAPETPVSIVVRRGSETISITAEPRRDPEGNGLLGIVMSPWPDRDALRRYSLPEAITAGVKDMVSAVVMTLEVPARVIRGDMTPQEARPSTVVGISGVIAFALQQSLEWGLAFPVLQTAALISLALGLTNLLPLPALDGGRILFVLVESIRGRRISPEREAMFHFVGLIVLVGLLGLMMIQDVVNPVIPWSFLK